MNPNQDKNFEQYINQLVRLLKKIVKHMPPQGNFLHSGNPPSKDSEINLNVFFLNLLPMSPEELDELEEIYGSYIAGEENFQDFPTELSPSDKEFLRQHGIRF